MRIFEDKEKTMEHYKREFESWKGKPPLKKRCKICGHYFNVVKLHQNLCPPCKETTQHHWEFGDTLEPKPTEATKEDSGIMI